MANIWTHYFFASDVRKVAGTKFEDEICYNFGAQGPDFLFYLNFLPWKKKKGSSDLGTLMHRDNTDQILDKVFRDLEKPSEQLRSYLYGFLAHYALDSAMHPFIYFHTKNEYEQKRLESTLDVAMFNLRMTKRIRKQNLLKIIDIGSHLPEDIENFYSEVARDIFGLDVGSEVQDAYRDMRKYLKLTRVSNPLKVKFLKNVSKLTKKNFDEVVYDEHPNPEILTPEMFKEFINLYNKAKDCYVTLLREHRPCHLRNFDGDLY